MMLVGTAALDVCIPRATLSRAIFSRLSVLELQLLCSCCTRPTPVGGVPTRLQRSSGHRGPRGQRRDKAHNNTPHRRTHGASAELCKSSTMVSKQSPV
jgi:hypothetical protein